jgi:DsbC/DsbD-like thiol-disulfide interchange protein
MNRSQLFGSLIAGLALVGVVLTWHEVNAGGLKSDSKVKATATATKIDDKGMQTVTITLDILKGWHLYANPVEHEFLGNAETKVTITGKQPVAVQVKYPPGKKHVDGKETYNVYENRVTIQASVKRAAGDTSPLQVSVAVSACNNSTCLQPATVKLTVP